MTEHVTEFTGKEIVRAVYVNPSHDTIRVEFYNNDTEDRQLQVYNLPADHDHYAMKALMNEGYDFERVQHDTSVFNMQQSLAFNAVVKKEAESRINKLIADYDQKISELVANGSGDMGVVSLAIIEHNKNEDHILKAKVALFESPIISQIDNVEAKSKLRSATSLLEIFVALNEMLASQ